MPSVHCYGDCYFLFLKSDIIWLLFNTLPLHQECPLQVSREGRASDSESCHQSKMAALVLQILWLHYFTIDVIVAMGRPSLFMSALKTRTDTGCCVNNITNIATIFWEDIRPNITASVSTWLMILITTQMSHGHQSNNQEREIKGLNYTR